MSAADDVLTGREREIVRLVACGLSNAQAAKRLGLTEGTVKVHLHMIFTKLRVESRAQMIVVTLTGQRAWEVTA